MLTCANPVTLTCVEGTQQARRQPPSIADVEAPLSRLPVPSDDDGCCSELAKWKAGVGWKAGAECLAPFTADGTFTFARAKIISVGSAIDPVMGVVLAKVDFSHNPKTGPEVVDVSMYVSTLSR